MDNNSNKAIKIQSIEPPPKRPQFKKLLDQLQIGTKNTFRVEMLHWSSLRNAAGNANRKTNKQFTVHKVKERGPKNKWAFYARVWRIK